MSDDLESRLRRLEDLSEIHQLFVDYGQHLDAGRFDEYAALFATDGEVRLGPLGKAKGRAAIQALMAQVLDGLVGTSYHIISSPVVQLAGDQASAEVMWTVVHRGAEGQPVVGMIGRHRDDLVREDGRWRFRVRSGFVDIPSVMAAQEVHR